MDDVNISTKSDGFVLKYNSSTEKMDFVTPATLNDNIIIADGQAKTLRGLDGNDTYFVSNLLPKDSTIEIVDTSGTNTVQIAANTKVVKTLWTKDAARLTFEDDRVITINGADKFTYDIGGNKTNNEIGKISTFSEFADLFGVEIPSSGQVKVEDDKIVYNDKLAELYSVEVKK